MSSAKLKFYQKEATKTRLADATPYEIIQLLMLGAMDNLALAKGAVQRKDFEIKSIALSKVNAIIHSLRSCLDFEVGAEISENLYALYSYMLEKLADASIAKDDTDAIDEVTTLLREIKSAWDQIGPEAQRMMAEQSNSAGVVNAR